MQDLTLVGMHEDGEHLVLTDPEGQTFRVRVDESLRAAVRRERPRPGQLQVDPDGLRPREIQARIRAGQSAEEVAESAGVPVEHVRRFEGPVLAEREFVASQARGVRLRRSGSMITSYTLGELVQQRLGQREVDDADTGWDAWRDDDGSWVVCLTFHAGSTQRRAHWTYDTQLRHVSARDDEARWFTEEERTEITATGQRRLTPIRDARDVVTSRDTGRDGARDPGRDDERGADGRLSQARVVEGRATDARYAEDYPQEHYHPDRYESARYGEDRLREDPYRDEIYGEDRPAEVRRATIDLLDTLRERRGRRAHLAPADQADPGPDAVDAAVETLRTRAADPRADDPDGPRQAPRGEPDLVQLTDDVQQVIELPDDEEPARRRPSPAGAAAGRAARSAEREAADRGGPARAGDRGRAEQPGGGDRLLASDRISPAHPAGGRRGERPAEPAARTAPSRGGRPAMPPAGAPAAGGPAPARTPSRGGRKAPVGGYPSPAAPPAPPAPARDRQVTAPVDDPAGERTPSTSNNRRNKRASVPSWDDIIFGSRRE